MFKNNIDKYSENENGQDLHELMTQNTIKEIYRTYSILDNFIAQGKYELALERYKELIKIQSESLKGKKSQQLLSISYNRLGDLYEYLGKFNLAADTQKKSLKLKQEAYGENSKKLTFAVSYASMASVETNLGNYLKAESLFKYAIEVLNAESNQKHNLIHSVKIQTYIKYIKLLLSLFKYEEVIEYNNKTFELIELEYKDTLTTEYIDAKYNLVKILCYKGKYYRALDQTKYTLMISKKIFSSNEYHPKIAHIHSMLGNLYKILGKPKQAIDNYEVADKIIYKNYSYINHPDRVFSYVNLAINLVAKKEYGKALELYEKALFMANELYGQEQKHPIKASILNNIGILFIWTGEYDKAFYNFKLALEYQETIYGKLDHDDFVISNNNLAEYYKRVQNFQVAKDYYKKSYNMSTKIHEFNANKIALSSVKLGFVYYYLNYNLKAFKYAFHALKLMKIIHEENLNHPNFISIYNLLGYICLKTNKKKAGLIYLEKALDIINYNSEDEFSDDHIQININLGSNYCSRGKYGKALKYGYKALNITQKIITDPNNLFYDSIYIILASTFYYLNQYEKATIYYKKAYKINKYYYVKYGYNIYNFTSAVNLLIDALLNISEYERALNYAEKFKQLTLEQIKSTKLNPNENIAKILMQFYCKAILKGDYIEAAEYYNNISLKAKPKEPISNEIDIEKFNNHDQINLLLTYYNKYFARGAIKASINCAKALLKVDPDMHHGNYYYNLALCYGAISRINSAAKYYKKAIDKSRYIENNSCFNIKYAYFLICNNDELSELNKVNKSYITYYLLQAIEVKNVNELLKYNIYEQFIVDNLMKEVLHEGSYSIEMPPKLLCYYLLLKYPEYIPDDPNFKINKYIKLFKNYCHLTQDLRFYKLLIEALNCYCKSDNSNYINKNFTFKIDNYINLYEFATNEIILLPGNEKILKNHNVKDLVTNLAEAAKYVFATDDISSTTTIHFLLVNIFNQLCNVTDDSFKKIVNELKSFTISAILSSLKLVTFSSTNSIAQAYQNKLIKVIKIATSDKSLNLDFSYLLDIEDAIKTKAKKIELLNSVVEPGNDTFDEQSKKHCNIESNIYKIDANPLLENDVSIIGNDYDYNEL